MRIDEKQYPTVAELTVRLAEDHAEQEFTHGLADLLDRLANHPGATPRHVTRSRERPARALQRDGRYRGSCVAAPALDPLRLAVQRVPDAQGQADAAMARGRVKSVAQAALQPARSSNSGRNEAAQAAASRTL